jgi:hypothetical protein
VLEADDEVIGMALQLERKQMIRPTVIALALCVVSSAKSMPYVPLQQPNNSVIQVRQMAWGVNWSMASVYGTPRCGPWSASAALEKCAW